ncbi:helix-turn-helix domain-containing protein [Paenibacillus sp. N4]|uniref:helix-turn-helix domain-containing protein n=1 Tax=Paenibacillus vietnamensis TaxID=2590547 RepID=UPI001CD05488|nr:helix-turn-helix domain-containing protein [Paenibacillus vietnamensis]MCA0754851.1 helix-turn-helix domain-containing protein [Paenibacillus vietnamensis]
MDETKGFEKETLEVTDIKQILGCGINQAYKLVNSGEFHVIRIGKKIKVPKDSFYKWFNGQGQ